MNFFKRLRKRIAVASSAKVASESTIDAANFAMEVFGTWTSIDELHIIIQHIVLIRILEHNGHLSNHDAQSKLISYQYQGGKIASSIVKKIAKLRKPENVFFIERKVAIWRSSIAELKNFSDLTSKMFLIADAIPTESSSKSSENLKYWFNEFLDHTRLFLDLRVQANQAVLLKLSAGNPSKDFRKCLLSFSKVDRALFDIVTSWLTEEASQSYERQKQIIHSEAAQTRKFIEEGLESIRRMRSELENSSEPVAQKLISTLPLFEESFRLEEKIVRNYLAVLENISGIQARTELLDSLYNLTLKRSELMSARLKILQSA